MAVVVTIYFNNNIDGDLAKYNDFKDAVERYAEEQGKEIIVFAEKYAGGPGMGKLC